MLRFFYLDASALGKRYAPEVGTPLLNHLFTSVPADRLYVFNVGMAEVASVLVRKRNAGHLIAADFARAMANFGTEIVQAASVNKVTADNDLVTAALPLIETRSINGTDAILLRSALDLAAFLRTVGQDLVLVASDQRLLRAAQTEGLTTFDPEREGQTVLDALLVP
ncbi:MAG TPA: type II toxin-antitoxin system VapC family toxin [Gemmataceae bacterium]|nr:type II toxin-antitoxin system VapC family toxin [Gemmataceae bacterium]